MRADSGIKRRKTDVGDVGEDMDKVRQLEGVQANMNLDNKKRAMDFPSKQAQDGEGKRGTWDNQDAYPHTRFLFDELKKILSSSPTDVLQFKEGVIRRKP
jgi:hypothetical protein